jgi:hypothetical protein
VFSYQCARCGCVYTAPEITGPYGELSARSTGRGALIAVHALDDSVFKEVSAFTGSFLADVPMDLSDRRRGQVVQIAWSAACDPDEDGTSFVIGRRHQCPDCGAAETAVSRETGEFAEVDLPTPRYSKWHSMTESERASTIRAAVIAALSA